MSKTWRASNLAKWVKSARIEYRAYCPAPYALIVEAYCKEENYFLTLLSAKKAFRAVYGADGKVTRWTPE